MNHPPRLGLAALASALSCACVTAPPMIIADRKTALEEQAAGSFPALDQKSVV